MKYDIMNDEELIKELEEELDLEQMKSGEFGDKYGGNRGVIFEDLPSKVITDGRPHYNFEAIKELAQELNGKFQHMSQFVGTFVFNEIGEHILNFRELGQNDTTYAYLVMRRELQMRQRLINACIGLEDFENYTGEELYHKFNGDYDMKLIDYYINDFQGVGLRQGMKIEEKEKMGEE